MSPSGTAAAGKCWNCGQAIQASAATCLWCGVAARKPATQFVVAPGGAPPQAAAPSSAPAPASAAPSAPPRVARADARAPLSSRAQLRTATLGPGFAGSAAPVGIQVAAFTVDVLAAAAVAVTVGVLLDSTLLAVLSLLEMIVLLWVMEARTGLTPGGLLFRLRYAREDRPWSPGAGRALLRQALTGLGLLGAIIGAWVLAASGAWDRSGRRRSLAARAAHLVAVKPPRKAVGAAKEPRVAAAAAPVAAGAASLGLAAPRVVSTSTLASSPLADSQSVSARTEGGPGAPVAVPQASAPVAQPLSQVQPLSQAPVQSKPGHPSQPAPAHPGSAAPAASASQPSSPLSPPPGQARPTIAPVPGSAAPSSAAPASPAPASAAPSPAAAQAPAHSPAPPAPPEQPAASAPSVPAAQPAHTPPATPGELAAEGALLLVFDTGQRATLALGAGVNLGRRPVATEPTDLLVAVEDPEGTVSKTHARLEHSRGRTWVTDQGSTNGTELLDDDGITRLAPGARTPVEDGMRVRLGNRTFTVSVLLDTPHRPETAS